VALLEAFTGLGGVVGVALAFGLAPQLGWRVTYLAICGCVVYVGVLRFGIPESPRWLASVGRVDEALLAVEKLEREHGRYENATVQDKPMTGEATTVTSLDPFPVSTLVLSVLWAVMAVSAYALGVYVPSLISLWGFNMFSRWSTMALLGVAQAFGCVLASLVLGDCDRKQALVCFVAAAAVAAVVYSHAPWNGPLVIGGSFVVSAFIAASRSCVLVYAPENFKTNVRGRGVGYAFGLSRVGAIAGSLLPPHMFNVWLMSASTISWVFAALLVAVVGGVVLPYGKNTLACEEEGGVDKGEAYRFLSFEPDEEGLPLVVNGSKEDAYYS